jgi:hypothetical protein
MNELAVCTIITKSYLPYARTLAGSLARYNPNVNLYVLLADKVDNYFNPSLEAFKFIYLEDLSDPKIIEQMCFYYTPFELCCGLRGLLHEYMLEKTDVQKWLFLDSDIMVCNSLTVIFNQLENSSILLTPHVSTSATDNNYADPDCEITYLKSGLYNAGFLGLRRTDTSRKFISWFKNRLKSFSFHDYASKDYISRGLFVDQLWLNLVPLYFKEVEFCLEPGANLGHWNIFERLFDKDSLGNITVDGKPLLFVHFSGWDIQNIDKVSKYTSVSDEEKTPSSWLEISKFYKDSLIGHGYKDFTSHPYAFNFFQNSELITLEMRHKYYDLIKSERIDLSPFSNEIYDRLRLETTNSSPGVNKSVRMRNIIKRIVNKILIK